MKIIARITFLSYLIFSLALGPVLAETASLLPNAVQQFFDNNGNPLTSGKVTTYAAGTSTLKTTWKDSAEATPNTNPITLDAGGKAIIYGSGNYRQVVKDRNGNLIWDAVTAPGGGGSSPTSVGDGNLVGTILPWSGLIAPNQYVFAYGQELARLTYPDYYTAITQQLNVICTSASNILTGLADTQSIKIGEKVELALCVPAGTTVTAKSSTTITLSNPSSVSINSIATFFPWGNGNGTTTFNVPDLRGYAPIGRDNMGGSAANRISTTNCGGGITPDALGAVCGSDSHTQTLAELAAHTHSAVSSSASTSTAANGAVSTGLTSFTGSGSQTPTVTIANTITTTTTTTNAITGSSVPFSIIQPSITLNYIAKVTPDTSTSIATGVFSIGGMTGVISCGSGLLCSGNIISAVSSSAITSLIGDVTAVGPGNVPATLATNQPGTHTWAAAQKFSSIAVNGAISGSNVVAVAGATDANLFDILPSADTVAIGVDPTIYGPNRKLVVHLNDTDPTDTNAHWPVEAYVDYTATADTDAVVRGLYGIVHAMSPVGVPRTYSGLHSGTAGNWYSLGATAVNYNGPGVTGVYGRARMEAPGTVNKAMSFFADTAQNVGGGTLTNTYGLYITNFNYGTNQYGVFLEGEPNQGSLAAAAGQNLSVAVSGIGTFKIKTAAETYIWPTSDPGGTTCLKNNGAGVGSWSTTCYVPGQIVGTSTNDNATAGNFGEYQTTSVGVDNSSSNVTMTIAAPAVVTWTGHGLCYSGGTSCGSTISAATAVKFATTGALPTGLVAGTTYYAKAIDANTFNVATTCDNALAGTFITTTGSQSGTQSADIRVSQTSAGGAVNAACLSLTAGDWTIGGQTLYAAGASTTLNFIGASLSSTSATVDRTFGRRNTLTLGGTVVGNTEFNVFNLGPTRFSLSGTTTIYIETDSSFGVSTMTASGWIQARRAR